MSPHSHTSEYRPTNKLSEREFNSPPKEVEASKALSPTQSIQSPVASPNELISQEVSPGRESLYSHKSSPIRRAPGTASHQHVDREKQIDNLSRNLKKKIEEVFKAEDSNKQLQEKIQRLKEQSELTSKIAKEDYALLQKELNRTSNIKEALEKEVTEIESHLLSLKSKANHLEIENRALQEESLKVELSTFDE